MSGLPDALEEALGAGVVRLQPVAGGDINQAAIAELSDGRVVFVKHHPQAPPGMFAAEAEGLAWLAEPGVLRIPRVLASGEATEHAPAYLVLELLQSAPRAPGFDERLGRGLAALHRAGAPGFGWHRDNFIGTLPQANTERQNWPSFYRDQRLAPMVERTASLLGPTLRGRLTALMDRLEDLVPDEPPARLHGDLWGGNLHVDEHGEPALIDPAPYGGHREMDLAMMKLFGGFGPKVFAAYHQAYPLEEGHEDRVPLCQLYPLLVHVALFGRGYVPAVQGVVGRYT